jgi:FixJ family two-component response regulator
MDPSSETLQIGTRREGVRVGSSPLISVVDDDEGVRESLGSLMRSVGFGVKAFASAEEFLNSDHPRVADCLVLDVRMQGMSGLELQRRLVASQCRIPVIFISAHGDEEVRARALREGAVDFLLKPFSEEALLSAIQSALNPR